MHWLELWLGSEHLPRQPWWRCLMAPMATPTKPFPDRNLPGEMRAQQRWAHCRAWLRFCADSATGGFSSPALAGRFDLRAGTVFAPGHGRD